MTLIFYLSSLPKPPAPELHWANIDKVYHLLVYIVLGFLVARAFRYASYKTLRYSPWILALLLVLLYAASDEWHQSFVLGRTSSIADWIADSIGCLLGVLTAYVWHRLSTARTEVSCPPE